MTWALGFGIVLILLLSAAVVNHRRWLDKQSPVGVWMADVDGAKVTLQFEGGPHEGTYKQLVVSPDGPSREFGHWAARRTALEMLIMASERKDHPRFGQNTHYTIRYVRPDAISISGPDLPSVPFVQAPEGTTLDFQEERVAE